MLSNAEALARAFGAGSDARIACQPLSSCPYPNGTDVRRWWVLGWRDVEENWGKDAKLGWRTLLPPVKWQGKESA